MCDFPFWPVASDPKVEELALCPEVVVNTNLALTVGIIEHGRKYHAERSWS